MNPASNTWFVGVLIALGLIFFGFVIWRTDIRAHLTRGGVGFWLRWLQQIWTVLRLAGAGLAMAAATL